MQSILGRHDMKKLWKSSAQRGTLLVEAIAMLALIAMVTPTLYRKSAERLQEIQDINIASQMRTLNAVVDSFIKANSGSMIEFVKASGGDENTFELCYEDDNPNCYSNGYSSMVPFGYNPNDVRHFMEPRIYVYGKDGILQYYIVYTKESEIGKKRATRLASLIGSNGGVIQVGGVTGGSSDISVSGTGNAWSLDNSMISDIDFDTSILTEDSLMITATEPIVIDQDENDVYLYRVPPADTGADYYKNTMITDLYMGGHSVSDKYEDWARDYYSIFNVRKLTLNTICTNSKIVNGHGEESDGCVPVDVADLYVGKPRYPYTLNPGEIMSEDDKTRYYAPNEGAAWIYGNLSAMNDNFRVFRGGLTGGEDASAVIERAVGYDVMQFARLNNDANMSYVGYDDSSSVDLQVLRASNEAGSARVSMMDGIVNVVENYDDISMGFQGKALLVGQDSSVGGEGSLLTAFHYNDNNFVRLNSGSGSSTTWINKLGGNVYINKIAGLDDSSAAANTYINDGGGRLLAGNKGEWLRAAQEGASAQVHLLDSGSSNAGERIFTVGNADLINDANMMYGDSTKVSLRSDRFGVYNQDIDLSSNVGGLEFAEAVVNVELPAGAPYHKGATVVATQTLDVLGSTYLGGKSMSSDASDGAQFIRNKWHVGVAGSAWVDDTLWARRGWLKNGGAAELHAGFSSFSEFDANDKAAWLNVYNDPSKGVVIRNKDAITDPSNDWTSSDVLFQAFSSGVHIWGNATGASSTLTFGTWEADKVMVGAQDKNGNYANVFEADINAANLQGSALVNIYTTDASTDGVINVQEDAMQFRGKVGSSGVYGNEILAQARWFGVTADSSFVEEEDVQFRVGSSDAFADASEVRVKNADFVVRDSSNVGKFWVRPDEGDESSFAQVNVDGSFHVTGNEVIHIASNAQNSAEKDSQRAMFEIDPNYIQVWGKHPGGSSYAGSSASDYYAMLKINPYDTEGGESSIDDVAEASIYIRKGAIELMKSENLNDSSSVGASEGFGYIKANRLVSNSGVEISIDTGIPGNIESSYDEYMVNPAYTSVMHDIKLTTRGGSRLSDILPDYVLKGVYNVANDFIEGSKSDRIKWSCGTQCPGKYNPVNKNVQWANSYVGKIPYPMCPPGYLPLSTIMPISFMMGQAGDVMKVGAGIGGGWGNTDGKYYVNLSPVQAGVLANAENSTDVEIGYPGYHRVRSVSLEALNSDANFADGSTSSEMFKSITSSQIEGWFLGMPYEGDIKASLSDYEAYMEYNSPDLSKTNVGTWKYKDAANHDKVYSLVQPLYFQQNTWLKTSVEPQGDHWAAYMGFIYDTNTWVGLGSGIGNEGLLSNASGTNSSVAFLGYGDSAANLVWNLFPVPTNSIEGHATVYCYFDRTVFRDYKDTAGNPLVDPIDQMENYRPFWDANKGAGSSEVVKKYIDRLDDPTLKYRNPW